MLKNQGLIDLLKTPENLRCALEISDELEKIKNDLRLSFWEQIDSDLRRGLGEAGLASIWSVGGLDELKKDPSKIERKGVYLIANELNRIGNQLQLGVWQEAASIYSGIMFSPTQPVAPPVDEVNALWKGLAPEWKPKEQRPGGRWLCYKAEDVDISGDNFFLAIASGSAVTFTQPMADAVVDLLCKHHELVQAANGALSVFKSMHDPEWQQEETPSGGPLGVRRSPLQFRLWAEQRGCRGDGEPPGSA